jgi:hypothetical protein
MMVSTAVARRHATPIEEDELLDGRTALPPYSFGHPTPSQPSAPIRQRLHVERAATSMAAISRRTRATMEAKYSRIWSRSAAARSQVDEHGGMDTTTRGHQSEAVVGREITPPAAPWRGVKVWCLSGRPRTCRAVRAVDRTRGSEAQRSGGGALLAGIALHAPATAETASPQVEHGRGCHGKILRGLPRPGRRGYRADQAPARPSRFPRHRERRVPASGDRAGSAGHDDVGVGNRARRPAVERRRGRPGGADPVVGSRACGPPRGAAAVRRPRTRQGDLRAGMCSLPWRPRARRPEHPHREPAVPRRCEQRLPAQRHSQGPPGDQHARVRGLARQRRHRNVVALLRTSSSRPAWRTPPPVRHPCRSDPCP